ncbi:MAG: hypothetical protein ACJ8FY_27050 [Gemmataceae bacterium]
MEPGASSELATLTECWQRWTDLVEACVSKSRTRRADRRYYDRLHKGLLKACRILVENSNDPDQCAFYQSLEELAKPWLSLRILARTDDRFLANLLDRCRAMEERLTGRKRRSKRRWLWPAAAFIGAAAGVAFWQAGPSRSGGLALNWLRSCSKVLYRAAVDTTLVQWMILGGIGTAMITVYIVTRVRRS